MSYTVRLTREAVRTLDRVDRTTEDRMRRRLRELADDPFAPRRSKLLSGLNNLRSSRVGGWRIIFTVEPDERVIFVVAIRPRGQAYRGLR